MQNHGFASIGALSETVGWQRFGTAYRARNPHSGRLYGELLPVDLAATAAGMGADVLVASSIEEFEAALRRSRASGRVTVVEMSTDPLVPAPDSEAWWDVPVAEVAQVDGTRQARAEYEQHKATQKTHLSNREKVSSR